MKKLLDRNQNLPMDIKPIRCAWVIDDDPLQVLVLNRLLTTHQAVQTTKFFSGAKSAIEALNSNKNNEHELPDLVFLDLIMSKGDGWDFLEQNKKLKGKIPRQAKIIVISSFNEDNYKRIKQYPDVINFLPKPIDKDAFDGTIEAFIKNEMKK